MTSAGLNSAAMTVGIALVLGSPPARAEARQRSEEARVDVGGERPSSGETVNERAERFRFGPLVGVGFPRPFAIEGLAKIDGVVGVGFEYSFMPRVNVMTVDTGFNAVAVDLRVFPFRSAFFIGARAGRQWLDAKGTLTVGQFGSFSEAMSASTWFLNPRMGVLYTFQNGVSLGIDAGLQIPIRPSYQRTGAATDAGIAAQLDIDGTLLAIANTLGNETTATVDLLRIGFLF